MAPQPHVNKAVVSRYRWLAVLLLLGFTLLYMTTLAGNDPVFKNRDALFFADASDYVVATRQPAFGFSGEPFMLEDGFAPAEDMKRLGRIFDRTVLVKKAKKHPLFFPVNHLCYSGYKKLVHPLRSGWTIGDERLALLFPSALFGAAAVAGLFLFFLRQGRDHLAALLFALLFGVSLGKWVYSSLPETYSLQILISVGLVALIFKVKRLEWRQALLLAMATAAAILVSVGNILLVVPLFLLFLFNKKPWPAVVYAAIAALTVVLAYAMLAWTVSPELALGKSLQLAGGQVLSHSAGDAVLVFNRLASVTANHFFFSIGAIHVAPGYFTRSGALFSYLQSPLPALFIASYVVFLILLILRLIASGFPTPRNRCLTLVAWLAVHLLFYSVFNSAQPFLYASIFLVPLITLMFLVFTREGDGNGRGSVWLKIRRGALALLVLATWLDNQFFVLRFLQ